MKLRTKITAIVIILMFIVISTVGIFTYYKSSSIVVSISEDSIKELSLATVSLMSSLTDKEVMRTEDIAAWADVKDLLEQYDTKEDTDIKLVEKLNNQLYTYIKSAGNIESSCIVSKVGRIISNSNVSLVGRNLSTSEFFKKAVAEKKPIISDILTSESSGDSIVVFIYPVKVNGEIKGYVCNSVISKTLLKPLENLTVLGTESGYAYVVDKKNVLVYHPTKEKIGKEVETGKIKTIIEKLNQGENIDSAIVKYDYEGKNVFASYNIIPQLNWLLVLCAENNEVQIPVNQMGEFVIILGIVAILISSLLVFGSIFYLTKPLGKITELVNRTSNFDLVYDKSFDVFKKRKDETGIIATALVDMRNVLRDMANVLMEDSSRITSNADKVFELTEKMNHISQENSATTQQLSAGMEETSASSEEITASVDEIEDRMNSIVDKTLEGAKVCDEITIRAVQLKEETINSINEAKSIYNNTKIKMEEALEETKTISQINALADSILAITKQTNLLALNAAIEAARAGEAGKGFGVVANEIKMLADESSKTASDIQKIVSMVNESVKNINESSLDMLKFMDQKVLNDYDKLIKTSEQYNSDAETVNELIGTFNSTAQDLNITIESIATAIREVGRTVNECTVGIQDIASKTTEVVFSSADIEDTAKENINSAKKLESLVKHFKL